MGFWRSLRQWWCWDGSPDADPFRAHISEEDGAVSGDFSVHAHSAADDESPQQADEDDA